MCEILIFGGTTEGRLLAEFCAEKKIHTWVSVVSDYGKDLLAESPWIHVKNGAMDQEEMISFIRKEKIRLAIDATHPYAKNVSENVRLACAQEKARLVRCLRESEEDGHMESAESVDTEMVTYVDTIRDAVRFLNGKTGNILVTTGSHELAAFRELPEFAQRVYARVLPSSAVVKQCEELGIAGKHLICMQGPFSESMNRALIEQTGAAWMVTKESGAAGGFAAKISAAVSCGVHVVVIRRPQETGRSFEEVCAILENYAGMPHLSGETEPKKVILAGIGMGGLSQMTTEVQAAIRKSDVLFGAGRMLESAKAVCQAEYIPAWRNAYQPDAILEELRKNPQWRVVTVLYSGDTGFYSGAAAMAERLTAEGISFRMLPGISSVSYFAARLGISWWDARIWSAHGRERSVTEVMESGAAKQFVLMGGENGAGHFCRALTDAGYGAVKVTVGENLSYPEERIRTGTAAELAKESFAPLSLLLIERSADETI